MSSFLLGLWLSLDFGVDVYTVPYLSSGLSLGSDEVPGLSFSVGVAACDNETVYPYLSIGYSVVLK